MTRTEWTANPQEHNTGASTPPAVPAGSNNEQNPRRADVAVIVLQTGRRRWRARVAGIRRLVERRSQHEDQTRGWLAGIIARALGVTLTAATAVPQRAAHTAGLTQSETASDPVPQRHGDLLSTARNPPAQTRRRPRADVTLGDRPDPQDVMKRAEYLVHDNKYLRARTLVFQHLAHLHAVDTPADPLTVLRAARLVVCCDPRGIDPATRPWAWCYYRSATRRHGPGQPQSVDAARRLVTILRAGGQADQLAVFYRQAGNDFHRSGMHGEALRIRISGAQVLHQMGRCVTALRQLDHSLLQWREATNSAPVELARLLAMLHLPVVCGHPRQARRVLRRLPIQLPPPVAVQELLHGVHRNVTDPRSRTGHRSVCSIAAPVVDTVSERRALLTELRAVAAGRPLPELIDDDYLGHCRPAPDARMRIAVRTGSIPPLTTTLAKKLQCRTADVQRLLHAAADAGQSQLIIDAAGARPVRAPHTRPGAGLQSVRTVFEDVR